jgi:hypothetical protein
MRARDRGEEEYGKEGNAMGVSQEASSDGLAMQGLSNWSIRYLEGKHLLVLETCRTERGHQLCAPPDALPNMSTVSVISQAQASERASDVDLFGIKPQRGGGV